MLFRLAWRNLWRNPRRTLLTGGASFFASFLMLYMLSVGDGMHERWIAQSVALYTGHVEVSLKGQRENQTLDYSMELPEGAREVLDRTPGARGWAGRLESWALVLPDRDDAEGRAAWLVGIDPEREAELSNLGQAVELAPHVGGDGDGIAMGVRLAQNLGVEVGERVVLLASDYYGSQSAGRYRVNALLELDDPLFDGFSAVMPLGALQSFLEYPGGLSHVALFADRSDQAAGMRDHLLRVFDPERFEVLDWPLLIPDLVQMIVLDDIGSYLSQGIVLLVIAFGLLNTVLMSVYERVREFGVMRAMGSPPGQIFRLVLLESGMLSGLGIAIGFAIGVPGLLYLQSLGPLLIPGDVAGAMEVFGVKPELYFIVGQRHLVLLPAILLATSLLASLPPAVRASRGRPVDALREV